MASARGKEPSSSSSPIPPQHNYDVFLSFSGVDTRINFTSHLLAALERHGFHTFRDDTKLNRGEDIDYELLKAIEESRISLVVLSRNYAASGWCLDELVKIMECRKTSQHIVFPIFHGVEPSDVRAQKGSFAEAFAKHIERFKKGPGGKVEKWKEALCQVANLSGWDLPKGDNGDEAKLIQKIVQEVGKKLDVPHLSIANHQVGLESRMQKLNGLLSMESSDVRIIGIWGNCGIGKTTIAKSLYNLIQHKFEGSSFLANVRETSKQPNGLVVLQERLLLDIFVSGTQNIKNVDQGIEVMKRRAFFRKVLLVLDDVDSVQQLKALAIGRDSFAPGSRIIITTRDKSTLNFLELDQNEIYLPEELNKYESLELFSWHAFKEDHPKEDYVELSDQLVSYAWGLPLALEVLGSFLFRKSLPEWNSAMPKLKQILIADMYGRLKISFDSLNEEVKELFLDIACFFAGRDRDFTIKILEGLNFSAAIGIQVLADRCLIRYGPRDELVMDDMHIEMGREIVRQQSVKDPGKRSRLWYHEDALEVLKDGTGTEVVEGLVLNITKPNDVLVNAKAFEKMNRLWLLHLSHINVSVGFEHISRRLLWLCWNGFPLECLPSNFYMENLVALDLQYSSLEHVWDGTKILAKLKFLYLSHCHYLTRTPDFSGLNNLEELLLNDCVSLVDVDESIRCLNKLVVLDLKNCTKLQKIPLSVWMLKSLRCLDISGCSKLGQFAGFERLPSISLITHRMDSIGLPLYSVQRLSCLKKLSLGTCHLSHLPCEIGSLNSLEALHLYGSNLLTLPSGICNLTRLKLLDLTDCNFSHLTDDIGRLISLETLNLGGNRLVELPSSICNLIRLKSLDLKDCNVAYLPGDIGGLISLETLNLGGNRLVELPGSVCNLTRLKSFDLKDCKVSYLPGDIGALVSLETFNLRGNGPLVELPGSVCNLTRLKSFDLKDCNVSYLPGEIGALVSLETFNLEGNRPLVELPGSVCNLTSLKSFDLKDCNVSYLPSDIGALVSLETFNLGGNRPLVEIPGSICNLTRLRSFDLKDCNVAYLPGDIGGVISLETLNLGGNKLVELPGSICNLSRLRSLDLKDCKVSHLPGDIGGLVSLETLNVRGNNLRGLPGSICNLTRLKSLDLKGCNLTHLLGDIRGLVSLETLNLRGNGLFALPCSICYLNRLERLSLKGCNVSHLPGDIEKLSSLEYFDLQGNDICTPPHSISNLASLHYRCLNNCERLQSLPEFPVRLCTSEASSSASLESIPSEVKFGTSIHLWGCNKLAENNYANKFIGRLPQSKEMTRVQPSATERKRRMKRKAKPATLEPSPEHDEEMTYTILERKSKGKRKTNQPTIAEPSAELDASVESPTEDGIEAHGIVIEELVESVSHGRSKRCRTRPPQAEQDLRSSSGTRGPIGTPQPLIGPQDPQLLSGFQDHVAASIWRGNDRGLLKLYCHSSTLKKWCVTNERLQERINHSGLLPLCGATYPYCNNVLVSAFVERWYPETNSFHFPFGEIGITLDDVQQLLGLPVTGLALHTPDRTKDNLTLLQSCLGVTKDEAEEVLIMGGVTFDWLRMKFSEVSDKDSEERVDCCARAFLLYVLGTTLFVDKTGVRVSVSYLGLLSDLGNVGRYAWGAGALAYLYKQLGRASKKDGKQLSGYTTLLEAWIQEHFPLLQNNTDPTYTDDLPRARRWLSRRVVTNDSTVRYRHLLDNLQPDQVIFDPYKNRRGVIPHIAFYTGFIHCMTIVEPYMPDRVLRQFGLVQSIPGPPIAPKRGGRGGNVWTYGLWECWENHLLPANKRVVVRVGVPWECTPDYLAWFRTVSHFRVAPGQGDGDATGGAAERNTAALALLDRALAITGTSSFDFRRTLVEIWGVLSGTMDAELSTPASTSLVYSGS